MTLSISGKTAIVTGASCGIGRAIARHFVDRGARVMFADYDEARLREEIGTEAEDDDGAIRWFAGDLDKKLAIANLLSATIDAFDRIDIVVNASRTIQTSDPLDPDDPALDVMMRRNLFSALKLS